VSGWVLTQLSLVCRRGYKLPACDDYTPNWYILVLGRLLSLSERKAHKVLIATGCDVVGHRNHNLRDRAVWRLVGVSLRSGLNRLGVGNRKQAPPMLCADLCVSLVC
jgi:hypothetical protein